MSRALYGPGRSSAEFSRGEQDQERDGEVLRADVHAWLPGLRSNPTPASSYTVVLDDLPEAEFGWGGHSVNVRITTQDASGTYHSDWWPQLVVHQQ